MLSHKNVCSGVFLALLAVASAGQAADQMDNVAKSAVTKDQQLLVYKSPSCGCCTSWVEHLATKGFSARIQHTDDMDAIKNRLKVPNDLRSCHTAVSAGQYVFEGHVPARYIQQFLAKPPAGAIGLAVPAMPVGSPGMEAGDRFMPYQVLLLQEEGSSTVYANVRSSADQ